MIRPIRQGLNRAGRLVSTAGYEAAAARDEQVRNIVRSVVFVYCGTIGIIPHSAGPQQMPRRGGIFYRRNPILYCAAASNSPMER